MTFTADGKAALMSAVREASRLGHDRLGAEHLLLGLLAADGPAAERLRGGGIDLRSARVAVAARCPMGEGGWGRLPWTEELGGVVEAAAEAVAGEAGSLQLLSALAATAGVGGRLAVRGEA